MPSPSAASENDVVYCAGLRGALSVSPYVKHQTCPPPPGHIQCVSHAAVKRCSALVSVYSGPSRYRRPCMQCIGLQPACYIKAAAYRTISRYPDMKCYDISISWLGYDTITTRNCIKCWPIDKNFLPSLRLGSKFITVTIKDATTT